MAKSRWISTVRANVWRWILLSLLLYSYIAPVSAEIRFSEFFHDVLFFLSCIDLQFPIDVNGVQKDHPFLDLDSLQSLFRRLHALNRCANMKLDFVPKHAVSILPMYIVFFLVLLIDSMYAIIVCGFRSIRNASVAVLIKTDAIITLYHWLSYL